METILTVPNDPWYLSERQKGLAFMEGYLNPGGVFCVHVVSFEDPETPRRAERGCLTIHAFREPQFGATPVYPWRIVRVLARFVRRLRDMARLAAALRVLLVRAYGISHLALAALRCFAA